MEKRAGHSLTGWTDRLTFRVVFIAIVLPVAGILAVSLGVQFRMRAALLETARAQAESVAGVVVLSVERAMVDGRARVARKAADDLRGLPGVTGVEIIDAEGRAAFDAAAPVLELDALARLQGGAFSLVEGDTVTFYRALENRDECRRCHAEGPGVLGAVRIGVSLAGPLRLGSAPIFAAFAWSLAGTLAMGIVLWWTVRTLVVRPAGRIRVAAAAVAAGDLGVDPGVGTRGEMGALGEGLRGAVQAMAAVVRRIHDVAQRVEAVSARTEQESAEVVHATAIEAESFDSIAATMEELNASIGQISNDVRTLATAAVAVNDAGTETAGRAGEVLARTGELTGVVEQINATIEMLSHTIRELSWGARHLTDVSGATLTAVDRLEGTVRAVESAAGAVTEHTRRVRTEAEELGLGSVRRALGGMESIREAVGRTAKHLDALGALSRRIGEILDVIDEVTDRTGLLALNAAILGAQAGEQGAGFRVVAAEIRKLAVRTAGSTGAIAEVVSGVREEIAGALASMRDGLTSIEQGVLYARDAGAALETIVESAGAATESAAAIPAQTAGQVAELVKVRESMARLEQMAAFLAQGSEQQNLEADRILASTGKAVAAAQGIRRLNEEQGEVGKRLAASAETVADGVQRIARAIDEEREGSSQLMHALVRVVDLPRENRALALRINQGLREVLGGTELLRAEAGRFRVPEEAPAGLLRLGVLPLESPAVMHRRFTPLAELLAARLGRPVELRVALDFDEAVADLGAGRTRLAWLSPSTYVRARLRFRASLLVTALRDGKPVQHAVIVTRRGSGIRTLDDLRGRTFAFGDPRSTSSHIVPRAMLLDAGVRLESLGGYAHLGHHDVVAQAVLNGEYDAGAVMETVAARLAGAGLDRVADSPPIPEFCLCAAADLPEADRAHLIEILVGLGDAGPAGRAVLEAIAAGYTGFAPGREADYDAVRAMMERLGLMGEEG